MVGEVREYDELADIYQKLDTVRITTSVLETRDSLAPETVVDLIMVC